MIKKTNNKVKLQLALDFFGLEEVKKILEKVHDVVDIIELGTLLLMKEGIKAVKEIKSIYPDGVVLADLKIMDGGKLESELAFSAGADIVTVLGAANDNTISDAIEQSRIFEKSVMVDMMEIEALEKRTKEIDNLLVDYICIHKPFDSENNENELVGRLREVKNIIKNAEMAVAGGINLGNIDKIVNEKTNIVIIGSGITKQQDIRKAIIEIRKRL